MHPHRYYPNYSGVRVTMAWYIRVISVLGIIWYYSILMLQTS